MFRTKPLRSLLLIGGLALLTACVSPEEKADDYARKGAALVAEGDYARAYVEFRNALQQVPDHRETLAAFADALKAEGKEAEAYRYRLRLAELDPETADTTIQVAEMAIRLQDWANAEVYGRKALTLAPEDPRAGAIGLMLDYRSGVLAAAAAGNEGAVEGGGGLLARARSLMKQLPDNEIPYQIAADALLRVGETKEALAVSEEMVRRWPDVLNYHQARLQILYRLGDEAALETAMREMADRFPDDDASKTLMIRYYLSKNRMDDAETFLRAMVPAGKADDRARGTLVQFLAQVRGRDAARAELDKMIAEGTNTPLFSAMKAVFDFEEGKRDEAVSALEGIVAGAEPSAQTREIRIMLARLLMTTGNQVGARQQVETVLAEDPGMVQALQMQAAWLIDGDKADEAISTLRRALDQEPNNPDSSTLLAQAYLRTGDRDLAGDMLARAAADSNNRPAEAMRQARFLMEDEKWLPAESVLVSALRVTPNNPDLLATLGEVYVRMADWVRAEHVEKTLRESGAPVALQVADRLRVAILQGQQRDTDAMAFLEDNATAEGAGAEAQIAVLRAHIAKGDMARAREYLDGLLAEKPDDATYRFLDAALVAKMGDMKAAADRYARLVIDFPDRDRIWIEYFHALNASGQQAEADTVLAEALTKLPDSPDLNWAMAGVKERAGDAEGAIAIYEKLYALNSGSSVVANNLASLLTTARKDPESLDRAWTVARRLRGSDIPAFQDTYGWIAHLRGDHDEALRNLEPAAKGLPDDPSVGYHLGLTYAALGRKDEALATLKAAAETAAGQDSPVAAALVPVIQAEITRLEGAPATGQ